MNMNLPRIVDIHLGPNASVVDQPIFVAESGSEYELLEVIEDHAVAGSDGGAVTADIEKAAAAVAVGAGTTVLSSTFDLKSTADTPITKNTASGLVASKATRTIKAGERLLLNIAGTTTASAGVHLVLVLKQLRKSLYR